MRNAPYFSSLVKLALVVSCVSCGPNQGPVSSTTASTESAGAAVPVGPPQTTPICSALSFSGVSWPATLKSADQMALELALNITSSFEGVGSWGNLTNDFDQQGFSMGLLDQTLGTGSLQPLFVKMRNAHIDVMRQIFSAPHLQSLLSMLATWQASGGIVPSHLKIFFPLDTRTTDDAVEIAPNGAAELASVLWARANLYTDAGVHFKPDWAAEFTKLGNHPDYVQLQALASVQLHALSRVYFDQIGIHELRSYLFAFDMVAQDGGFHTNDLADYRSFLIANPKSSNTDRLKKLLELRLREVRPEFVNDVRSRKLAVIQGTGPVHGASRNLEKQYCYSGLSAYQ